MLRISLKAGSLIYSLIVSIIIALLCGFIIYYKYLTDTIIQRAILFHHAIQENYSAINYLISIDEQIISQQYSSLNNGDISTFISKYDWGAYSNIEALTICKKDTIRTNAITGKKPLYNLPALYMPDNELPISMAGNSLIDGDAYISKAGFKRAYIEGKQFVGERFLTGQLYKSKLFLPEPTRFHKQLVFNYLDSINLINGALVINDAILSDSLFNSFSNPEEILFLTKTSTLIDGYIKGNFILKSNHEIIVSSSAKIEDVIIYAKTIKIEEDFSGNAQFFASDTLILNNNITLNYPSFLGLYRTKKSPDNILLYIGEDNLVYGGVLSLNLSNKRNQHSFLTIGSNTIIKGITYTDDLGDFKKCDFYGPVFCNKFYLKTPSSVYENHLLDVQIKLNRLSKSFVYPNVTNEFFLTNEEVLKWIY
jgi:hypothetical protein